MMDRHSPRATFGSPCPFGFRVRPTGILIEGPALAREVRPEDEATLDAIDAEVLRAEREAARLREERQAVYEMVARRSKVARAEKEPE